MVKVMESNPGYLLKSILFDNFGSRGTKDEMPFLQMLKVVISLASNLVWMPNLESKYCSDSNSSSSLDLIELMTRPWAAVRHSSVEIF